MIILMNGRQEIAHQSGSWLKYRRLVKETYTQVVAKCDCPAVRRLMTRQKAQKCRLPGTVLGNHSYLIPFVHTKGDRIEEHTVTIALGQIFDLQIRFH